MPRAFRRINLMGTIQGLNRWSIQKIEPVTISERKLHSALGQLLLTANLRSCWGSTVIPRLTASRVCS